MTYNAANRQSIRAAEKLAKVDEAKRQAVIVALCDHADGRQYLWEELEFAHIFQSTMSESRAQMAFLEGQRSMGLRLLGTIMQYAPARFTLMMEEANGRSSARELAGSKGSRRDDQGQQPSGTDDYANDPRWRANEDGTVTWTGDEDGAGED